MTRFRLPPRPPPKRRPVLAACIAVMTALNGSLAALSLVRFFGRLAEGEFYAYPDLGPLVQLGCCGIFATNAAILASIRLQALPWRWSAIVAAAWLGLTFGVMPPVGTALLARALKAHGYAECRPVGWLNRGLWVRTGERCP